MFPWIGDRAISDLTPADALKVLQRIEKRGAIDTAHRAHQNISQVFKYAIATGRVAADPSASLKGALTPLKGLRAGARATSLSRCFSIALRRYMKS